LGNDVIEYELASGDEWTKSDARKVTSWYNDAVGNELKTGNQIPVRCAVSPNLLRKWLEAVMLGKKDNQWHLYF
jgi:hypothetical protein